MQGVSRVGQARAYTLTSPLPFPPKPLDHHRYQTMGDVCLKSIPGWEVNNSGVRKVTQAMNALSYMRFDALEGNLAHSTRHGFWLGGKGITDYSRWGLMGGFRVAGFRVKAC